MTKTIISTMLAISLFFIGVFFERKVMNSSFSSFECHLKILDEKTSNKTATLNDARTAQDFWHKQKEFLHVIIPHTEIKEIDLWLSEAVKLIEQNNHDEAKQKIEVLLELTKQIPHSFNMKFENIF